MKATTHINWIGLLLVVVGALLVVPVAGGASKGGVLQDGWMSAALSSTKDAPLTDGWMSAALSQTAAANAPLTDGWMSAALSSTKDAPLTDGWMSAALSSTKDVPLTDGWMSAALSSTKDAPLTDGWMSAVIQQPASSATSAVSGTVVASSPSTGFDFTDAAVGSGATLAALLLIALSAGIVRRTRHSGSGQLAGS